MKEAHEHIKASSFGNQINFLIETDTKTHLPPSNTPKYNVVTLSMSIWYFPTLDHVFDIFETIAQASIPKSKSQTIPTYIKLPSNPTYISLP